MEQQVFFDFKYGFRTSLIVTLAAVAALIVDADAPWLAGLSALTVANSDWTNVWRKGAQRVLGTIIGAVVGYIFVILFVEEQPLQMIAVAGLAILAIYKRLASPNFGYAWLLGAVTALLAIYISIAELGQLFPLLFDRALNLALGVAVAAAVTHVFIKNDGFSLGIAPFGKPTIENLDKDWVVALCVSGAVVAVTAPIIYDRHDLTGTVQIAITSMVVLCGPVESVKKVALNRAVGCFVGGVMGLALAAIAFQEFFWWLIAMWAGLWILTSVHHGNSYWAYAGTQAGYAFVIAALASSGPISDIQLVLDRLVGVVLGAIIGGAALFVVRVWQGADLSHIDHLAKEKTKQEPDGDQ
ncbi:Fusaric acid resistance protein family protein [Pseudovibrio sp. W64]|uniref:FUSC family protein n=1 Tax=unclassified Pseudovibrio TaxID=2627060 RepID=UPI0007AE99F7|nr:MULTISPECIES: FUSC family protein [unclassified Pseudovibrio]KZK83851.1 Fusaric acid resistance protein family protein [Pseudovibrio sp. W64]